MSENTDELLASLEQHHREARQREARERVLSALPVKPDIGRCGIPAKFTDASLDTWQAHTEQQASVLASVRKFADRFEQAKAHSASLLFTGGVGTGKSTLACALVRHVDQAGHSALYVHQVAKWLRSVKESFAPDAKVQASQVIERLVLPELLVLDEVGVQYRTPAELTMLTELIDDRYGRRRATVLISNLPGAELTQLVGERAADRLQEFGAVLRFDWGSFRQRKRGAS